GEREGRSRGEVATLAQADGDHAAGRRARTGRRELRLEAAVRGEAEEVALGRVGPCFRGEDAGLECRSVPAGGGPELRQLLDLGPRTGALLRARTGRGAVGAGGLVRVHDVGAAS